MGSCDGIFIPAINCQLWTRWKPYILIINEKQDLSLGNKVFFNLQDFIQLLKKDWKSECMLSQHRLYWDIVFFFSWWRINVRGVERQSLLRYTLVSLHVFFFTLSEAAVAMASWSYIRGVRYKEPVGGSANLSHAGSDNTQRERQIFSNHEETKKAWDRGHHLPDCFFIPSQGVKQKCQSLERASDSGLKCTS